MNRYVRFLLIALFLSLLLMLPAAARAAAPLSSVQRAEIAALVGERTGESGRNNIIRPGSSLAEAVDWLTAFADEEIGYVRRYSVDLIEMAMLVEENAGTFDRAAVRQDRIETVFKENAQLHTTINYYLTKLLYNHDRLAFLLEITAEENLSADYLAELSGEMIALRDESITMIGALSSEQSAFISAVGALANAMTANGDAETIRAAAQPFLAQSSARLLSLEAPSFSAGNNDFEIEVLSTKEIGVLLDGKVKGATVKMWPYGETDAGKVKTATTNENGIAIFWIADFKPNSHNEVTVAIEVTMDGMRTKQVEKLKMEGAEAAWLKLEKDDGKPYFTMLCFNGKDMLSQENEIYISEKNTATQALHFRLDTKGQDCTVIFSQGWTTHERQMIKAGETGIITMDKQWCRLLKVGKTLDFEIRHAGGTERIKAKLMPRAATFPEPVKNETAPVVFPVFEMRLPDSIPIVGGGKLHMPSPFEKARVHVDLNGSIYIGLGSVKESSFWQTEDLKDRLDYQKKIKKESIRNKILYEAKSALKEARARKESLMGDSKATFSPYMMGMLRYNAKTHRAEGGVVIGINIAYSFEVTQSFMMGPVPGYIGFDMKASFGVGAELGAGFKYPGFTDWRLSSGSGVHVSLGIDIGVTAGAGIPRLAYVQIRGHFATALALHLTGNSSADPSIYVGLDLEVRLLFFSKSWRLAYWEYPDKFSPLQGMLVTSAMNSMQYVDPMDISHYPYFEDVVAAIIAGGGITAPAGSGLTPVEPYVDIRGMSWVDTNFKVVFTKGNDFIFFIARVKLRAGNDVTRVCWVSVGDAGIKEGYLDNPTPDRNDIFDYDFDTAYYVTKAGEERIALAVQSGKREGIKILGPDATDEQREVEFEKARRQTRIYAATYSLSAQQSDMQLLGMGLKHDGNLYYCLPRVVALREPFYFDESGNNRNHGDAYAAFGYALINYDSGTTPRYLHVSTCFLLADGRMCEAVPNSTVEGTFDARRYSLDDMTLMDFSVKGRYNYYYAPVVAIVHAKDGGKDQDMVAVLTAQNDNEYHYIHKLEGSLNTLTPIRVAKQGSLQEEVHGVFLMQNAAKSGTGKQSKVSALWMQNPKNKMPAGDVKMTYRDYGMIIGADGLETTTVAFGSGSSAMRQMYAYWPQSMEKNSEGKQRYEIRAVLVDLDRQLLSPSFSLLTIDRLPLRAKIAPTLSTNDAVKCYFLCAEGEGINAKKSIRGVKFRYTVAASLESVAPFYPVIGAGDPLELVTTFKNEGNLVIQKLLLTLYLMEGHGSSTKLASIVLDTSSGDNQVSLYAPDGVTLLPAVSTRGYLPHQSAFRLPGMYDEYNCEVVITQNGTFDANGNLVLQSPQTEQLKGLMPGNTNVYNVRLDSTPKQWHGNKKIRMEIEKINATFSLSEDAQTPGSTQFEVDAQTGRTVMVAYDAAGVPTQTGGVEMVGYARPYDEQGMPLDMAEINLGYNDQTMDVTMEIIDDVPYAIICLNNLSNDIAMDSPAVLTSSIGGMTVFSHTFTQSLSDKHGYILKIPLSALTGGLPFEETLIRLQTVAELSGPPSMHAYQEFSDVDNLYILSSRAVFEILGPESVVCYEGEDAQFAVTVIGDTGPYTYQWEMRYPNGVVVTLEGETGPTLLLENVQLSDDGKVFWCMVFDSHGNGKMSQEALLTVLLPEPLPPMGDTWPVEALGAVCALALMGLGIYSLMHRRRCPR